MGVLENLHQGLARLNSLPPDEAEAELLKCCSSVHWARQMVRQRPFSDIGELFRKANNVWWSLGSADWLEAFRSHPKIGEKKAAASGAETSRWSEEEQSGTRDAAQETMAALATANREFEDRFGYIFIVCATGKSSEEMLGLLRGRLNNDPETELRVAAEEQLKITQLRLEKLLDSLEPSE